MKKTLRVLSIACCAWLCASAHAAGNLKINLAPASAITAGAQWRVDGGAWQASGATVKGLQAGTHNVEFRSISGWIAPVATTAAVTNGNTTTLGATYVQAASLRMNLTPTNAQWRVDGGAWVASGIAVSNLAPGSHAIEYAALAGHVAPAGESITLAAGQNAILARSYTQLAQVTVTLSPAQAQWRVDGGAWQASGATVANLMPGAHAIDYAPVAGYTTPASESITLAAGQSLPLTRSYVQLAQVTLTLTPANAQWRIDGGAWQASGATVANLSPGAHAIEYAALSGYTAPAAESVTLAAGQTLALNRAYVQLAQITVTLAPAGGRWRVDGGAWQTSGAVVANLAPGPHAIDYLAVNGYVTPAAENVTLVAGQSLTFERAYVQMAQILIGLVPSSGQWRANGGPWQPSGASLYVAPGSYTIDYASMEMYDTPANDNVTLAAGGLFATTRYYTSQRPTLRINLGPTTGQWRLNGGAWQTSGTELTELATGAHTIDYTDIGGDYAPLPSETVTLALRDRVTLTRTYPFKPGSISVTLTPSTGQWNVSGAIVSPLQNSGATLSNLPPGNYRIDYAGIAGYDAPPSEDVVLAPNQSLVLNRTYGTHPATIAVTLNPSSGSWRIYPFQSPPAGAWHYSGEFVGGLTPGSYTIDYSVVSGYDPLPAETVTLASAQTLAITRSYIASTPPYAIIRSFADAGAPPTIIRGSDGAFYVATTTMGSFGSGQIFRINADGSGYTVVKSFLSAPNAAVAPSALIEGSDHVLYGTTNNGGLNTNNGTVFKVNKDGTGYAILRSFDNVNSGSTPNSLIEGSDGLLYGTTTLGGSNNTGVIFRMGKDGSNYGIVHWAYGARGVSEGPGGALYAAIAGGTYGGAGGSLFKVNKDGTGFVLLRNFAAGADGAAPRSPPLPGSDGALYGTTSAGGTANKGTVYRINGDGSGYALLRSFLGNATDGGRLDAPLSEGPGGVLYGVTFNGGSNNRGTVFRLNKDGTGYAIIRHFLGSATDGGVLVHRVLAGADNLLYGATNMFGGDGTGLLFRMNADGSGFSAVRDFGAPDGAVPVSVMEASNAALYGVTYYGGGSGKGAMYKVNKDGTGYAVLHRFGGVNDGLQPNCRILEASDGLLYGTTVGGGPASGTLFRINKDGTGYAIVHAFGSVAGDAAFPYGGVIEGSDGVLYGTTIAGGASGGYGTVYRINKDGSGRVVLKSFANGSVEGNSPAGLLVESAGGVLYGTLAAGGTANVGTVFAMNKDGTGFTVLHQFAGGTADGSTSYGTVLPASDGRLYGTTSAGGAAGKGIVFGLNPDGSGYTILRHFSGGAADGAVPNFGGLVERNGALLGTTNSGGSFDGGTLYSINKDGTGFNIVINFGVDNIDGRLPTSGLFKANDGTLYGTTNYGGNGGTVFRLRLN